MKKVTPVVLMVIMFYSGVFADEPSRKNEFVVAALEEGAGLICGYVDVETSPKSERKSKKKKWFRRLILTAVNLTIQVLVGKNSRDRPVDGFNPQDIKTTVIGLCDDLHGALESEGRSFPPESCLYSIFEEKDERVREKLLSEKLSGLREEKNQLLQEIFSCLFDYCSDKLTQMHGYLYDRVAKNFTNNKSFDDSDESYRMCHVVASSMLDRVTFKQIGDSRANVPAILCLISIIAHVGDLVFGEDVNLDTNVSDKQAFVAKLVVILKDLKGFLLADGLWESFEKISDFMSRLDEIQSEEEWHAVAESFLQSSEESIEFLEELFSSLRLYLEEKLADVFAGVFCQLTCAMEE